MYIVRHKLGHKAFETLPEAKKYARQVMQTREPCYGAKYNGKGEWTVKGAETGYLITIRKI